MVRTLARGAVAAGLEVHVATTDDNEQGHLNVIHGDAQWEEGVAYYHFKRQTRSYIFSWPLTRWLARHVRDYDLIHIHALFSYTPVAAAYWASRYGIPYIVRPLGTLNRWGMQNRRPWLKQLSFRSVERRILNGASAIHYTSEEERRQAEELGISRKSVVIPNALGPAIPREGLVGRFRANHPELAGRPIILFLSRLDPKKGLDLLLPAFARMLAENKKPALVIAGDGDPLFVKGLQKEANRLGLGSDILWAGFLQGEQKWAALTDSDIFVLPSYSENFGVAAAEAMAMGLPVVISNQLGIHQTVAQEQAGLIVPCQVGELARALLQLLDNAPLRESCAANARRLAEKEFTQEAVTHKLIALYTTILSHPWPAAVRANSYL